MRYVLSNGFETFSVGVERQLSPPGWANENEKCKIQDSARSNCVLMAGLFVDLLVLSVMLSALQLWFSLSLTVQLHGLSIADSNGLLQDHLAHMLWDEENVFSELLLLAPKVSVLSQSQWYPNITDRIQDLHHRQNQTLEMWERKLLSIINCYQKRVHLREGTNTNNFRRLLWHDWNKRREVDSITLHKWF